MAELKEAIKAPGMKAGASKEVEPRPIRSPEPWDGWGGLPAMRRFAEEIDQMFEGVFQDLGMPWPQQHRLGLLRRMFGRPEEGAPEGTWAPRIDVMDREGQLVIHAELPGLAKDDVRVEVSDDLVTIRGERKEEKREEKKGYYYSECRHGGFYRSIPLPEGADASKATADFRNGVLEVRMPGPKPLERKARSLEIKST
ncbi:MAG: Hsp20/alpha crystallin family protein [Isosphaeraceae bacterium]